MKHDLRITADAPALPRSSTRHDRLFELLRQQSRMQALAVARKIAAPKRQPVDVDSFDFQFQASGSFRA